MKHFLRLGSLLIILLISRPVALAQKTTEPKAPVQFGEVTKADFLPSRDSAAAAEILCDYGQSGIVGAHERFQVVFERVTRIRILSESRATTGPRCTCRSTCMRARTRSGYFKLKGCTYNLVAGKIEKDQARRTVQRRFHRESRQKPPALLLHPAQRARGQPSWSSATLMKSDFLFNLQDWQFQHAIPVRWSEYRATLPARFFATRR